MADSRTRDARRAKTGLWENLKTIVYALLIAVGVRTFLFEPFNIPSGSMIPTLLVGDYVFTTKFSYGYSRFSFPFAPDLFTGRILFSMPRRGDVAVFRETKDTTVDYIKRIVGLPGDRIQVKEGQLYLNGTLVPRDDLGDYQAVDENGVLLQGRRYLEHLPSEPAGRIVDHQILKETSEGAQNDTPEYVVPPGDFFAMGDNRDDSADSRFQGPGPEDLGYVPIQNLVGRARIVFFSVDGRYPLWEFWEWPFEIRWSRLFTPIR
jgi:signal peptidase I